MTGTNFNVLHPLNSDVRVRFSIPSPDGDGYVTNCDYLGLAGYLPTDTFFARGCLLTHIAEAKLYINQANDGLTPNFVGVDVQ